MSPSQNIWMNECSWVSFIKGPTLDSSHNSSHISQSHYFSYPYSSHTENNWFLTGSMKKKMNLNSSHSTGCSKSNAPKTKNWICPLKLKQTSWFFLSMIERYTNFIFIKICLRRLFVKYQYQAQQETFTFSQIWNEINILNKASH